MANIYYSTIASNVATDSGSNVETELGNRSLVGHTHKKSEITDFPAIPTKLPNPSSLTVKFNSGSTEGTNLFTYDGSSAKTANITPSAIGAAASSHTHTKSEITDFPTSLKNPSSLIVKFNGGSTEEINLFTYDGSSSKTANITPSAIGAAASSHTHTKSEITDFPTALKNPTAVTIQANGTSLGTYDGSAAKTFNLTYSNVGAAAASHTHTKSQITDFPTALKNPSPLTIKMNGSDGYAYDGSTAMEVDITPSSIGAAASSHTHTKSQITDFPAIPTKLPNPSALTVKLNGGTTEGTDLFTYTGSAEKSINITPSSIGASASDHTHTKSQITDFPTSLKNPNAVTIQANGTSLGTYDGSAAKTFNLTYSNVGAAAASHTHTKSEITDFPAIPTKLPNPSSLTVKLNGGSTEGTNLFTYDGSAVKSFDITPSAIGASASGHTHNYAGSSSAGGSATSAVKLSTARTVDGVSFNGSANITHYGTCSTAASTAAKTVSLTGFTLATGAIVKVKFTVTNTASSPTLNVNSTGAKAIYYRGSAITAGTLAANRVYEFVYDGTNYELVGDVNTTYSAGTGISLSGTTFSNSGVRSIATGGTNGTISVNTGGTSAEVAVKGLGSAAYTASSDYAASSHTHTKSEITDFPAIPTKLPNPSTLTVKLNSGSTEGTNLFTYDGSAAKTANITPSAIGAAASSHTHTKSQITDFPTSLKNPSSLVVKFNGGSAEGTNLFTYDGSAAKTANITPSAIGAAASSHTHTKSQITDFPAVPTKLPNPSSLTVKLNGGTEEGTDLFTYDGSAAKTADITPSAIGAAAASHTHTKSQITDFPTSLKNPNTLTVQANGTSLGTYDGSAAKTFNLTYSNVGAAASSHTHTKSEITDFPAIPTKLPNPSSLIVKLNGGTTEGTDLFTYTGSAEKSINITPSAIGAVSTTGNAATATKWATARNINGLSVDGSANRVNYGSCSTAAATAAKVVSCTGFALVTGAEITVKFTVTNTASSPTLNVNSTGAKAIYYRGSAITAGTLAANRTYTFRYNGTQYELVGDVDTVYTHPTSAGNKHIPSGGASGQFLKWSASGTAVWSALPVDDVVLSAKSSSSKAYITGVINNSDADEVTDTQVFNSGVYLDTGDGNLVVDNSITIGKAKFAYDDSIGAVRISFVE